MTKKMKKTEMNNLAESMIENTIKAIEKKYCNEIAQIREHILTATDNCEFSATIKKDLVPNLLSIGGKLKQYFIHQGFSVEFYVSTDPYLKIIWNVKPQKQNTSEVYQKLIVN